MISCLNGTNLYSVVFVLLSSFVVYANCGCCWCVVVLQEFPCRRALLWIWMPWSTRRGQYVSSKVSSFYGSFFPPIDEVKLKLFCNTTLFFLFLFLYLSLFLPPVLFMMVLLWLFIVATEKTWWNPCGACWRESTFSQSFNINFKHFQHFYTQSNHESTLIVASEMGCFVKKISLLPLLLLTQIDKYDSVGKREPNRKGTMRKQFQLIWTP